LSPISVAWVDTLQPKLRWALGEGDGARVELCRSRSCSGEVKRFDVEGTELSIPEPLEPGFWFWRLFGKTKVSVGKNPSATWEVLVRQAGKAPPSVVPGGAILDFNGDGVPDLAVVTAGEFYGPELIPFLGSPDDRTSFRPSLDSNGNGVELIAPRTEIAAIDANGDGLPDLVFSDMGQFADSKNTLLFALPGSESGAVTHALPPILVPTMRGVPVLRELTDIDGDGYGDVAYATLSTVVVLYGSSKGLGPLSPLYDDGPEGGPPDAGLPTTVAGLTGGFASNINDASLPAFAYSEYPLDIVLGREHRALETVFVDSQTFDMDSPVSLAVGDFDGDGQMEIAFTTKAKTKPQICFLNAAGADKIDPLCLPVTAAPESIHLLACDLDGDGKDELLMTSGPGIDILHRDGNALSIEKLETTFGGELTLIHPGRPGPALWAAGNADGTAIGIFEGRREAARAEPPPDRRFAKGLR
jgi:hypothetical protein